MIYHMVILVNIVSGNGFLPFRHEGIAMTSADI